MEETTLAFTFNLDHVNGMQGLFSRDARSYDGDGKHLSIYVQNGTLTVRMQDGESQRFLYANGITAGQDHHLALSFGDGTGTLYVDGQEVGNADRFDLGNQPRAYPDRRPGLGQRQRHGLLYHRIQGRDFRRRHL
jgi:hypothetical protein